MAFAIRLASLLAFSVMHAVQHAKRCGCSANLKLFCVDKGHKATSLAFHMFSSDAIEFVPVADCMPPFLAYAQLPYIFTTFKMMSPSTEIHKVWGVGELNDHLITLIIIRMMA